jgi:hypothetical protein
MVKEVDNLYKILTRRAIREKEEHPINSNEIIRRLEDSLEDKQISLIYIWGADKKGSKADKAEIMSFDLISKTQNLISHEGFSSDISLLFCDSHAKHFNNTPQDKIDEYHEGLILLTKEKNYRIHLLSKLHEKWGISYYNNREWFNAYQKAENLFLENKDLVELLSSMAKKHSNRVKEGIKNPRDVAKDYAAGHILDDPYLFNEFEKSIFVTYSRPGTQRYLSNLPTVFSYSIGKGMNDCPWYLEIT